MASSGSTYNDNNHHQSSFNYNSATSSSQTVFSCSQETSQANRQTTTLFLSLNNILNSIK